MKQETQLKQQALMLKAAYVEGFQDANTNWQQEWMDEDWSRSAAKVMHDQLLAQATGDINVKTNVGHG